MFTQRSKSNMEGVHQDLTKVLYDAYADIRSLGLDIIVTEGLRDAQRQKKLLAEGKSQTLNSRHLTGHALDVAVIKDGQVTWDMKYYRQVANVVKEVAAVHGIAVEWGGDWTSLKDGTHFQLSWAAYPLQPHPKTEGNSKTIAASVFGFPVAAYIPELFDSIKSLVGGLTWFDDAFIKYLQLALVILIAAFVISERVAKMKREGV